VEKAHGINFVWFEDLTTIKYIHISYFIQHRKKNKLLLWAIKEETHTLTIMSFNMFMIVTPPVRFNCIPTPFMTRPLTFISISIFFSEHCSNFHLISDDISQNIKLCVCELYLYEGWINTAKPGGMAFHGTYTFTWLSSSKCRIFYLLPGNHFRSYILDIV